MVSELFKKQTGTDIINVTYKSGAPTLVGLLSNEIQLMFGSITVLLEQVKAGKAKGIAVTSAERFPGLPDTPTVAAAGPLPGFEANDFFGILAPAATPREIVAKINTEMQAVIKLPDVQKTFTEQGFVAVASSPEAFEKLLINEVDRWAALKKAIGGN